MIAKTVLLFTAMFLSIICNGTIKIVAPPILIFVNVEDGNKNLGNEASNFVFLKLYGKRDMI